MADTKLENKFALHRATILWRGCNKICGQTNNN